MNIVFFISSLQRGGAERVLSYLANDFVKKGDNITIIVCNDKKPVYEIDPKVNIVYFNLGKFGLKRLVALKKTIITTKPDIVLSFTKNLSKYLLFLFFIRKFKITVSEHSNPFYAKKKYLKVLADRLLLPSADGFIFLTKETQDYFPQKIRSKTVIIPNGLFAEDIPGKVTNWEDRDFYQIYAVGRLHKVKDYPTMIHAFSIFHKTHPLHRLTIYGDGAERQDCENLARQLELDQFIHFAGMVDRVVERIADAGMVVMTSKSEGFPIALLEAMACGAPCIATDCDFGPRQIITDGVNGLLVEVGNPEAFAKAMARVADDAAFAQKLSQNAVYVREEYAAKKNADLHYSLICSLIKQ